MFFKKIEIDNTGPISRLNIQFPISEGHPKPLVIVGENGSGKSILLSHLVNALIVGKQTVFEDVEVETGKVFKYRSPKYVKSGEYYSYSNIEFETGEKVQEWQLLTSRTNFEADLGYTPSRREWNQIDSSEDSYFNSTFNTNFESTQSIFKKQCCLYFPVNRFEEPAWLNLHNLRAQATYTDLKKITGFSNRELICTSPLRNNNNWLLDLMFDRQLYDLNIQHHQSQAFSGQEVAIFAGYSGPSANIYEAVLEVIRVVLRVAGDFRLGAGPRRDRQISVLKDEKVWVPNLFQLSTGEVQLINLFLSIVRDYDLSEGEFNSLSDIKGIVIIDEIDSHLHTIHQKEVLPKLIKSFPNIQFVITTHAPLFLLGMDEVFGSDGFEIISMPNGEKVSASDFSEFITAYEAFRQTTTHRATIRAEIEQHSKPVVFVEGDYDIRYLNKAASLLGKNEILSRIQLYDGSGFGNLDKIWKNYNNSMSEVIPNKIILLYDCDTHKQDCDKNLIYKRIIPSITDNPISIGVENLFSDKTIDRIEKNNPQFIDIKEETKTRARGVEVTLPKAKSVNKDEKGNMCNWLYENGDAEDFVYFENIFQIIEEIINR